MGVTCKYRGPGGCSGARSKLTAFAPPPPRTPKTGDRRSAASPGVPAHLRSCYLELAVGGRGSTCGPSHCFPSPACVLRTPSRVCLPTSTQLVRDPSTIATPYAEVTPASAPASWTCGTCTVVNVTAARTCSVCGAPAPSPAGTAAAARAEAVASGTGAAAAGGSLCCNVPCGNLAAKSVGVWGGGPRLVLSAGRCGVRWRTRARARAHACPVVVVGGRLPAPTVCAWWGRWALGCATQHRAGCGHGVLGRRRSVKGWRRAPPERMYPAATPGCGFWGGLRGVQGDGASFGLCKRCYGLIAADHESETDIVEWLVDTYVFLLTREFARV